MGLLEQVVGGLMNNAGGGGGSPMGGVLMNMLGGGGQQAPMQTGAGASETMPAQSGGIQGGGLQGVIGAFEQAGLGHLVQSWMGGGSNLPVSPQQLQNVFGENQVQSMASQAGMPKEDFLSQLSQHLPSAVNGMTPEPGASVPGTIDV